MLTPFTDADYDAFAGAEPFPCGEPPHVEYDEDRDSKIVFVVGGTGVDAVVSETFESVRLGVVFPNPRTAAIFVDGLPGTIEELRLLGFE